MKDQALYEKIEAYLRWEMSEDERAAFKAALEKNPQMVQQLEAQQLEHQLMEVLVEDDLLDKMASWTAEEETEILAQEAKTAKMPARAKRVPFYRRPIALAIAAAFLLLLIALSQLFQPKESSNIANTDDIDTSKTQQNTAEDLLVPPQEVIVEEENIEPQEPKEVIEPPRELPPSQEEVIAKEDSPKERTTDLPVEKEATIDYLAIADAFSEPIAYADYRTTTRGGDSTLDQALDSLEANKTAQGIVILKQLLDENEEDLDAKFYLGFSYAKAGDYEQAIPYLKQIAESYYLLNETAQWQLALSYLKSDRVEEGKNAIADIAIDNGHSFEEEAKALLSAIEKN